MIGVLIVTHGSLGKELLNTCELIMGKQEKIATLGLNYGDSVEKLKEDVKNEVDRLNDGEGVLVLTDLFGGSPSNAAAYNMKDRKIKCLTGVNLPMLIEVLNFRATCGLEELVEISYEAGLDGIKKLHELVNS